MFRLALPRPRWQRAALAFSLAAFVTFLINLVFVLWATSRTTITDGVGILAEQSCPTAERWSTGIHVVINALSTILLAGSNYCMQCLMAPTRTEIDDAHAKRRWLDVGVPSIRNLWSISRKRKIIWGLLAVSYNSIIFTSTPVNEYFVFHTDTGFLEARNISAMFPSLNDSPRFNDEAAQRWEALNDAFRSGQMEKLTVADCLTSYRTPFQSTRANLLLISAGDVGLEYPDLYTFAYDTSMIQPSSWMCENADRASPDDFSCDDQLRKIKADEWRPYGRAVKECHSQKTEESCKILFSASLCWIVISVNLFKGILMLFVAFASTRDQPLLTVGDAVASFLAHPDESTTNMCLKSKKDFIDCNWFKSPQRFNAKSRRKFAAGTPARWISCILFFAVLLTTYTLLLIFGLRQAPGDKNVITMGLGLNTKTVLDINGVAPHQQSLIPYTLLANTPQVIFSLFYFTYNALYTNLSLVTEWDRFGDRTGAKGLRVSSAPQGSQRDTYFLHLPYRYSIPLLVCSGGLHWLVSQSLFFVNIEIYDPSYLPENVMSMTPQWTNIDDNGSIPYEINFSSGTLKTCGWSPLGVALVVAVGFVMLGLLLVSAGRRLRFGGIPVAGSCSAAISAACHPNLSEKDASGELLRWGVLESEGDEREMGHCSFSAQPVRAPVQGQFYQ
ncbi:hypothetical protein CkaCkLH20_09931 [Colletotrichum karsti]|uniref:DUF6536 domain-containing protein n=1 Tax=Colletotrichum karsti TaxID=1095194 RepID=A0A9P6HXM0_9PEZI|nr:uncharacterized protein CkaCkLH20_09931 [Colletotrichum karsti]KAF9872434.1 hypothetical protein CkaCkLH20_09931 [Colletotrichum karsti]